MSNYDFDKMLVVVEIVKCFISMVDYGVDVVKMVVML